eukprot:12846265-Alexandrium_andersonii.AAC.1
MTWPGLPAQGDRHAAPKRAPAWELPAPWWRRGRTTLSTPCVLEAEKRDVRAARAHLSFANA